MVYFTIIWQIFEKQNNARNNILGKFYSFLIFMRKFGFKNIESNISSFGTIHNYRRSDILMRSFISKFMIEM